MSRSDKVVDDVGGGRITTGTAKPFIAAKAFYNSAGRMNTAISSTAQVSESAAQDVAIGVDIRASVGRKLSFLLGRSSKFQILHRTNRHACQAIIVIFVV
jgi:hypothetical protein